MYETCVWKHGLLHPAIFNGNIAQSPILEKNRNLAYIDIFISKFVSESHVLLYIKEKELKENTGALYASLVKRTDAHFFWKHIGT
jgi:hypothetical protein